MKKWMILPVLVMALAGCGNTSPSPDNSSEQDLESEDTVVYRGLVQEDAVKTPGQLVIDQLDPVASEGTMPFYEGEIVLLLSNNDMVKSETDGQTVDLKEVTAGSEVEVRMEKDAPMTRSLPPQIPGKSIKEITLKDHK